MKHLSLVICLLFLLASLGSCSSPEEKAKKELQEKTIEATANSLLVHAKEGNANTIQLLLTSGIPVDSADANGSSALALAASSGQTGAMEVLLAAGADKNKTDMNGDTALTHAVKMGEIEAAVLLVKSGARSDTINNLGEYALSSAIKNNDWPMVTALGKAGVNLDVQVDIGRTILHDIIDSSEEKKELAIALISGGADINVADNSGHTPFTAAVNHNQVELVALMAGKGVDVNAVLYKNNTYSALMEAVEMKEADLVRVLIEAGADVNFMVKEARESCLYRAVYSQQKNIVEMLTRAGANVNTHNMFQVTPLARVTVDSNGKNLEIADILVKAGADINDGVNEKGQTPLHLAVMENDNLLDSLHFLLEKGAATNIYDNDGHTPLTLAVLHNNIDAVKGLIAAGADVNHPAMTGKKPLFIAEELDYYKIAGKLRKAGATKK
jgi:ankyrin repeat protein